MAKVVREAEYFKNITHEEIDRQLAFMDRAIENKSNIIKAGEKYVHQKLKIEEMQRINSGDDIYI
jgi:hypothetical protein